MSAAPKLMPAELPGFGSKFSGSLRPLVSLAELVRADIAAAHDAGLLPLGFQAHVRSTGLGLRIRIVACAGVLLSVKRVRADVEGRYSEQPVLSNEGRRILDAIQAIACAYKRPRDPARRSSAGDFLVHADFDQNLLARQRAEIVAAIQGASGASS